MTQIEKTNEDQSYCTRFSDGVSGMSVTALAQFCGVDKPAITQLLNQISHSDPFTNDLKISLKPYAGNEWRLLTNDPSGRVFIIDEVSHAVLGSSRDKGKMGHDVKFCKRNAQNH
jgi:hypothetical protein